MSRAATLAAALAVGLPTVMRAQVPEIRGYYLNVATGSLESAFSPSGVGDLQRLRLMLTPSLGLVALDVAYEHALTYRSEVGLGGTAGAVGSVPGGTEWLGLQGTLTESDRVRWSHRIDRLAATVSPTETVEVTIGRQTISWATTLFLTPADPFVPFDPAQPFREYRAGVDAVRARVFPGGFSEAELVLRPSNTSAGETLTLLARGKTIWQQLEVGLWAGVVHDEASAGIGTTVPVLDGLIRGEGVVRRSGGKTISRVTVGVDRSFPLAGKDLYVVAEYQHDGFGAGEPGDLVQVLLSDAFIRRELQVLGRDVAALSASIQPHLLLGLSLLSVINLNDGSVLAVPALSYSAGEELTLQGGVFVGFGSERSMLQLPGSEYGAVPTTVYLSFAAFF